MKKEKKNNYRQYYKEYYNIDFGIEYDIHHIDQNRDNNDIDNLLLLPKYAHILFHKFDYIFRMYDFKEINSFDLLTSKIFITFDEKEILMISKDIYYWYDLKIQVDNEIRRSSNSPSEQAPFYQYHINKHINK